ncbi:uncharacterized protein VTP21DRAFT_7573 [Calcarisporiella thermophila]|uniref:uncharacterized protein n=1 Tax=Calcarisporiella thermophila TaxID=911321 RepID=UPI003744520D
MSLSLAEPTAPTANIITIEDAVLDSPSFRANAHHFEDELDKLEKWLDNYCKTLRSAVDELLKLNSFSMQLGRLTIPSDVDEAVINPDFSADLVRIFSETLQTAVSFRVKLASDLEEYLINPLQHLLKHDIKELKEFRKNFEKLTEKYELALNRYFAQGKTKEASALREDAFQLFEIRKSYIRQSSDYAYKISRFKSSLDYMLVEQFLKALGAQYEYHENSFEVYKRLSEQRESYRKWLQESRPVCDLYLSKIRNMKGKLEEDAIFRARPNRSLLAYANASTISLPASSSSPAFSRSSTNVLPIKQGYLFHRTSSGKRYQWTRKWFFIHQAHFGYCIVSDVGELRGAVVMKEWIDVLLCEVRMDQQNDRRFCFEVVCANEKTYMLQAETEEELQDWLKTFEKAKQTAIADTPEIPARIRSASKSMPASPSRNLQQTQSSFEPASAESETSLGQLSSTLSTVQSDTARPASLPSSSSEKPFIPQTPSALTNMIMLNVAKRRPVVGEKGNPSTLSALSSSLVPGMNVLLGSMLPSSLGATGSEQTLPEIANGEPEETAGAFENGESEILNAANFPPIVMNPVRKLRTYTSELALREQQLRVLFSEVHPLEIMLDTKPCALLQTEEGTGVWRTGRIFLTPECIYFYSCVVGFVVSLRIPLQNIKNLHQERKSNVFSIEIEEQSYVMKTLVHSPLQLLTRIKVALSIKKEEATMSQVEMFSKIASVSEQGEVPTRASADSVKFMEKYPIPTSIVDSLVPEPVYPERPLLADASQGHSNEEHDNQSTTTESQTPADTWPADLPVPTKPINCGCTDHLQKKEAELNLPISARALFELMFGDASSSLWERVFSNKGNHSISVSPWSSNERGESTREIRSIMPFNNPMAKVKETECVETQTVEKREEYLCYVVFTSAKTAQLPYADSFLPMIKYCITFSTSKSCKLSFYVGIKWYKNPMVKAMIQRLTMKGLGETVVAVMGVVEESVRQNRPRRTSRKHTRKSSAGGNSIGKRQVVRSREGDVSEMPEDKRLAADAENKKRMFGASEDVGDRGALDTILRIWSELLQTTTPYILIIVLVSMSIMLTWVVFWRTGTVEHLEQTVPSPPPLTVRQSEGVVAKAVYLRDLEENIIYHQGKPDMAWDKGCFRVFLLSRKSWNTTSLSYTPKGDASASADSSLQSHAYPWFRLRHETLAEDFAFTRERVGILRHDLLLLFRLLNRVEERLLESEYINWLMDYRALCEYGRTQGDEWFEMIEKNGESGDAAGSNEEKVNGATLCIRVDEQLKKIMR